MIVRGVFQVNMLSRSSQRYLWRLDMTVVFQGGRITTYVLLTTALIARVFLHWDSIGRSSRKWTAFLIFNLGLFPRRLLLSWVQLRQLFAVPPRFTRSIRAATVGWLHHGSIAHVDAIKTAAVCRAHVCDPMPWLPCYFTCSVCKRKVS